MSTRASEDPPQPSAPCPSRGEVRAARAHEALGARLPAGACAHPELPKTPSGKAQRLVPRQRRQGGWQVRATVAGAYHVLHVNHVLDKPKQCSVLFCARLRLSEPAHWGETLLSQDSRTRCPRTRCPKARVSIGHRRSRARCHPFRSFEDTREACA